MHNTSSTILDLTSDDPQGSLHDPLLFWLFLTDHPDVINFSYPIIFADNIIRTNPKVEKSKAK